MGLLISRNVNCIPGHLFTPFPTIWHVGPAKTHISPLRPHKIAVRLKTFWILDYNRVPCDDSDQTVRMRRLICDFACHTSVEKMLCPGLKCLLFWSVKRIFRPCLINNKMNGYFYGVWDGAAGGATLSKLFLLPFWKVVNSKRNAVASYGSDQNYFCPFIWKGANS